MKKTENDDILKKIYDRLLSLDPIVKRIAVDPPDPSMNIYFLKLEAVCYITTQSDTGRKELMFVTSGNKRFYNNMLLKDVDEYLKEHPHFLRTSKFHIVNLTKIKAVKYADARDLSFDGLEEPLLNGVSAKYLSEFEKHFK